MSEMMHVLARKSGREQEFVARSINILARLGLRTVGLTDHDWREAARWCGLGLSGYDATYVALAAQLGGHWLTDDTTAARKAPVIAVTLAEWVAP